MDLEQVLFGLDPFITEGIKGKATSNEVFKESYITLLNQLSVLLRDEQIRDEPLFKNNISKFIETTGNLLNLEEGRVFVLELLKVLINGIADNDSNRDALIENQEIWVEIKKFWREEFSDDEVNERIFILFENLIADDVDNGKGKYLFKVSELSEDLFWYLQYNFENKLATEIFVDLIKTNEFRSDVDKIDLVLNKLLVLLDKYREKDFIKDDDGIDEVIVNNSKILEILTLDLKIKFNSNYELKFQSNLLKVFQSVEKIEVPNKLKFQRQIYATVGNISSNHTSKNQIESNLEKETNGYIISSICLIMGNSINSNEDKQKVIQQYPDLVKLLISKFQYFSDPILFQGYLQLFKHIISLSNYNELFIEFDTFRVIIERILMNSKYYPNLIQLFVQFFKKLIVFMNKNQLLQLISIDQIFEIDDELILLLILNKLIIYKTNDEITNKLISKVMKFNQNKIEISTLFELTKTLGLLSNYNPNLLINKYSEELILLLTTIKEIKENNGAVDAIKNNSKYISGLLLPHSEGKLKEICIANLNM